MLRILRLALSFMLIFSSGFSFTMSEFDNKQETEIALQHCDFCIVCHEKLENDFLDLPCETESYCHQACFKDWAIKCLKEYIVPTCMLCRGDVDLNAAGIDCPYSTQTYAVAVFRRIYKYSLEKVISYQDVTPEGRELARKMLKAINEMSVKDFIEYIRPFYVRGRFNPFAVPPSLAESLSNFEQLKEWRFFNAYLAVKYPEPFLRLSNEKKVMLALGLVTACLFAELIEANNTFGHGITFAEAVISVLIAAVILAF